MRSFRRLMKWAEPIRLAGLFLRFQIKRVLVTGVILQCRKRAVSGGRNYQHLQLWYNERMWGTIELRTHVATEWLIHNPMLWIFLASVVGAYCFWIRQQR